MVMTCGLEAKIVHLLADQDQVVDIAGCVDPVRIGGAHLRDGGGMIHRADGVAFESPLRALRLDGLLELLRYRERKQVVARQHGDPLDVLVLRGDELGDRLGYRLVSA